MMRSDILSRLSRHRDLIRQLGLLVTLHAFSGLLFGVTLWHDRVLLNDRYSLYCLFHDTLQSLNSFGEILYWNPTIQKGFPLYYMTFLGWNGKTPLFLCLSVVVYLLGRVGIEIPSYLGLYIAYFSFVIPLLFSLSVFSLCRMIFRKGVVLYALIVLLSFSPAVLYSLTDTGIEISAYGFLLLSSLLYFIKGPSRVRLLLAYCMLLLVLTSVNTFFLFYNVVALPVFLVLYSIVNRQSVMAACQWLRRRLRLHHYLLGAGLVLACLAPTVILVAHGKDIVKSNAGDRFYSYSFLRPGNPLESLTVSTPFVSYNWQDYQSSLSSYAIQAVQPEKAVYSSFSYLGIPALPLVLLGLIYGPRPWRTIYGLLLLLSTTVIVLSAYSPFMTPFFAAIPFLRTCNHFSDCFFRIGGFHIHLVLAGLGLRVLTTGQGLRALRRPLLLLYLLSTVASVTLVVTLMGKEVLSHYLFGLSLVFMVVYPLLATMAFREGNPRWRRVFWGLFLMALTIELATVSFGYFRTNLLSEGGRVPDLSGQPLGSYPGHMSHLLQIKGLSPEVQAEHENRYPSVGLYRPGSSDPLAEGSYGIDLQKMTYNSFTFRCTAPIAANLILLDAFFPFWSATVNGAPQPVERGLTHFKMVELPPGESIVTFRFHPGLLHGAIWVNGIALVLAFALLLRAVVRRRGDESG